MVLVDNIFWRFQDLPGGDLFQHNQQCIVYSFHVCSIGVVFLFLVEVLKLIYNISHSMLLYILKDSFTESKQSSYTCIEVNRELISFSVPRIKYMKWLLFQMIRTWLTLSWNLSSGMMCNHKAGCSVQFWLRWEHQVAVVFVNRLKRSVFPRGLT